MTIDDAQADLRRAYVGGGPGIVISGLFWLIAYAVYLSREINIAYAALFLTGMLIFPLTILVRSSVIKRAKESEDNVLARVALEARSQ